MSEVDKVVRFLELATWRRLRRAFRIVETAPPSKKKKTKELVPA